MNTVKILIVDDDPRGRKLLASYLKPKGYDVLMASSGEEALEIARAERPDLIIMDIMMPGGMDGLETTRILKSDPGSNDAKIIMLTAKGQQSDIAKGMEAGADDYFVKPFSPLELIRKVEEILE